MKPLLAHGEGPETLAAYGGEWFILLIPFVGLAAVIAVLWARGEDRSGFFGRIGRSLERITGLPAWSAGGIGMGMFALSVAVIGFYWDVSWHIEKGRDSFIFTPAHMGILLGLAFIVVAGVTSILFATLQKQDVGLRWGPLRVPLGAFGLVLLGIGAMTGFPLDEFWHRSYGVDVTMWGPTHLVMISGASLSPLALTLLLAEAKKNSPSLAVPSWLVVIVSGATLTGLSTWTGEFDFGVPQFQQLYHPVLVMLAASIGLTIARSTLGRGGAIKAALTFLVIRSIVALLLGGGLGILLPRFPLYIVPALVVEAVTQKRDGERSLSSVLVAGALIGTVGLAAEWVWTQVWGWHPWGPSLFPGIIVAAAVAVPGVLLGTVIGDVLSLRNPSFGRVPLVLAGLGIITALIIPFPRNAAPIDAVVTTQPAGDGHVDVSVAVTPPDAAEPADWFEVQSWQGGSLQNTSLEQVAPGRYVATEPVPADGHWKSFVRLADKDVMVAVPVFLPADPEIGASEIPVLARREETFRRDTELLLREATEGSSAPAVIAYSAILGLASVWIIGLAFLFNRLNGARSLPLKRSADQVHITKSERIPVP